MKKIYQRAMAVALAGTTLLGLGVWHQSHWSTPAPSKPVAKNADALPTGVSEATLADIRKSLEKQEYHISYDEQKKKLQSPNRSNNIRAYYEPGKLTVQTRVDTTGDGFKMELVNEGIFADGKLLYAPEATAKADHHDNKVQISHDAFTEEFINNEDGVRQNFIIEAAPEGTRQLQVKMTAKGLKVEQGTGNELRFYSETANGETRNELVYSGLKCWDANKQPLNATLAYVDNRIQISVDVANAAYPVTIDPIIANGTPQNANKVLQIDQTSMHLGWSVSSAGDVNGDGYSDVIVGAPDYDFTKDAEGGAFVYKGDPSGLTLTAVAFKSNQIGAKMGYSVSTAGDFNGDGYSDVIVGIPYYDKDAVDEGRANLYLGSSTFFTSAITAYGFGNGHAGALMGINVATAGDIDGNGFSDILIAASQDSNGESKEGIVTIKYGNANPDLATSMPLQIDQPNAQFGYSVAPAGDIDADGFSDFIVGARWYTNGQGQEGEGAAFIYHGSATGQVSGPTIIQGNQYNAAMGNKVSSAGDVNGDGYDDVIVGAPYYDDVVANGGGIWIFHGSHNGLISTSSFSLKGEQVEDHFGQAVSGGGDLNGDGYSDVLVGSYAFDHGQTDEGSVFVWYGGNAGIDSGAPYLMVSSLANSEFGFAVSDAGDLNGDGFGDIIVGAPLFDNGQLDEGVAFLYYGGINGPTAPLVIESDQENAELGKSVAKAGDINGDGFDDLIIGAVYYSNGQLYEGAAFVFYGSISGIDKNTKTVLEINQANAWFGRSVDGAGDVNGDGYEDVIVGASEYDNNEENEGGGFLFYGAQTGINTNPVKVLEINTMAAHLGYTVSGAGDVNADGFDDVLVGAPLYTNQQNNEGAVVLYFGSSEGLKAVPIIIEGDQIDANVGYSVSNAGDINADGFDDIVVGAPLFTVSQNSEGAVFVYYGSPAGVSVGSKTTLSVNQLAYLGSSVASAGDVNGDGYSDIVLGAIHYEASQILGGAAIIHYGSTNGISQEKVTIISDIDFSEMGQFVSSAGDVNGDGVSDVLIGAPYYGNGAALLFYGNKNPGTHNNLRLYNSDLTTPINHTQFAQTNFGAGLFAKSFTGRNKGKLVWETRPLAQGFSKGSNNRITNSTQSTGVQNTYSNLGTTGFELKNAIDKQGPGTKVRVRVKYDPVLALTGQTYGPWRYLPAYLMGNSTAPVPEEEGKDLSETIPKKMIDSNAGEALELATIYPNPASNRLNIDVKDKGQVKNLKIVTAAGSVVYQLDGFQPFVDVSQFPDGAYFLIITKADGSLTTRRILIRR